MEKIASMPSLGRFFAQHFVVSTENVFQTAELAAAQEKQMEVCEVCGAFLIVGDAQSRIDDHLQGKQHVGYQRLRTSLEEIMVRIFP